MGKKGGGFVLLIIKKTMLEEQVGTFGHLSAITIITERMSHWDNHIACDR